MRMMEPTRHLARPWTLREEAVAPALVFIVLAAFAFCLPAQSDTFWHLRSGAQIWETRALIWTEGFSHTSTGTPLLIHWWLSQLLFFGLHSAGGPTVLSAAVGLLALGAAYGSWQLTKGSLDVRLPLLLLLVLAMAPEWSVRPQVLSLAFLVLTAHLVVHDRVVWLPLVCVVWANAHAMVLFGVVVGLACAVDALVWTRPRIMRDAAVAVASLAAPMLSPLGLEYWPRVFETIARSRAIELQEFRTPLEWVDAPFWIAVVALGIVTWAGRKTLPGRPRAERILLVVAAVLAVAGVMAARNVAFFAVIAVPVLSWYSPVRPVRQASAPAGRTAYGLLIVVAIFAAIVTAAQWRGGGVRLGWIPLTPAVVEEVRRCPDPLFNHMIDGGYLTWALPGKPIFIDSRVDAYSVELLNQSRAADLSGELGDLFEDYGINCALVIAGSPLSRRIERDSTLSLRYDDGLRQVFVRIGAASRPPSVEGDYHGRE